MTKRGVGLRGKHLHFGGGSSPLWDEPVPVFVQSTANARAPLFQNLTQNLQFFVLVKEIFCIINKILSENVFFQNRVVVV
jgi:hypothetical protein